jgi:hypothetical protein
VLAHARVDQNVRSNSQEQGLDRCIAHRQRSSTAQHSANVRATPGVLGEDPVEFGTSREERVGEGHAPARVCGARPVVDDDRMSSQEQQVRYGGADVSRASHENCCHHRRRSRLPRW